MTYVLQGKARSASLPERSNQQSYRTYNTHKHKCIQTELYAVQEWQQWNASGHMYAALYSTKLPLGPSRLIVALQPARID